MRIFDHITIHRHSAFNKKLHYGLVTRTCSYCECQVANLIYVDSHSSPEQKKNNVGVPVLCCKCGWTKFSILTWSMINEELDKLYNGTLEGFMEVGY